MLNMLKSNSVAATRATRPKRTTAFTAPEMTWASTYSNIDSGVMNMLLKLCDHTFHSTLSDIEYCATRMISHISVPRYR